MMFADCYLYNKPGEVIEEIKFLRINNSGFFFLLKDVVVMGAALEQAFYEKLAEMPSDVRFISRTKKIFNKKFN
jgi:hypothetical protein